MATGKSISDIRVGVVGFGLAGRVFHAPFVSAVPGLRLTAIVQRTGDDAAKAYPAATVYRSIEDLLKSDVDLVVIATPNRAHVPMAKQALLAGKHVVVDKPMAGTWEGAKEITALAKESTLLLSPFHCSRWHGDFATLKSVVNASTLGRLVTIEAKMDRYRPIPRVSTWKEIESDENGILMDLGPHMVDQAMALLGRPSTVTASVRADREGSRIADAFDLTLEFQREEARVLFRLQASLIAAATGPRFVAHGVNGSFVKTGIDGQQAAVTANPHVPSIDDQPEWIREDEAFWGELILAPNPAEPAVLERSRIPTLVRDYRGYYRNIRDALRGDAALHVTPKDGCRVIRLLELALQSSRERRTINVTDSDWE